MFIAERYTFIPSVAFCVLLSSVLPDPAFLILASLWFYRSHLYTREYKSNLILFSNGMGAFPNAPGNYNNVGSYYCDKRQWVKAIEPLLLSIKLSKFCDYNILANLVECYSHLGIYTKALDYLKIAQERCPKHLVDVLHNRKLELEGKLRNQYLEQKNAKWKSASR